MNITEMPINAITPFQDNPRVITSSAVSAVADSIREYGFQQPIVVDSNKVIIIGHTRHLAAQRLGMATVPVHIAEGLSDGDAAMLRLVDNRVAEMTYWKVDLLEDELERLRASSTLDLAALFAEDLGFSPDPPGYDDAFVVLAEANAAFEGEGEQESTGIGTQETVVQVGSYRWQLPFDTIEAKIEQWVQETNGSNLALRRHLLSKLGIV